jgi:hypothetical protein
VFIVFGFKVLWKTISGGRFICPTERTEQSYFQQRGKRWFTIFFVVPVIPLKDVGEVVQCSSCKQRFTMSVLDHPDVNPQMAAQPGMQAGQPGQPAMVRPPAIDPAVTIDLSARALRVCLAGLIRSDGEPTIASRESAIRTIRSNQMAPYDDAMLAVDLADNSTAPENLLWPLASQLDVRAKEQFIKSCLQGIGEPPTDAQRGGLDRLGRALGLTEDHIAGVVASVGKR